MANSNSADTTKLPNHLTLVIGSAWWRTFTTAFLARLAAEEAGVVDVDTIDTMLETECKAWTDLEEAYGTEPAEAAFWFLDRVLQLHCDCTPNG